MTRVVYQLDEAGVWYIRAADIPGCHSEGRSIEDARRNIREAIAAADGDPNDELKETFLPTVKPAT
jgi:predicted RNase H-like HicB family nuclease